MSIHEDWCGPFRDIGDRCDCGTDDLSAEQVLILALGQALGPGDHSTNCADAEPCAYCVETAKALRPALARAWVEGHESACEDFYMTCAQIHGDENPYRETESAQEGNE